MTRFAKLLAVGALSLSALIPTAANAACERDVGVVVRPEVIAPVRYVGRPFVRRERFERREHRFERREGRRFGRIER